MKGVAMDPTIGAGIAALTWLAVRDRCEMSRVLLAIGLFGLGAEPTPQGVGSVLVAMATGVVASLVWERLLAAVDVVRDHTRRLGAHVACPHCSHCRHAGLRPTRIVEPDWVADTAELARPLAARVAHRAGRPRCGPNSLIYRQASGGGEAGSRRWCGRG